MHGSSNVLIRGNNVSYFSKIKLNFFEKMLRFFIFQLKRNNFFAFCYGYYITVTYNIAIEQCRENMVKCRL